MNSRMGWNLCNKIYSNILTCGVQPDELNKGGGCPIMYG